MTNVWVALALACLASTAHARQLLQTNTTTNATCSVTEDVLVQSYQQNVEEATSILSLFNGTANATDADCVRQVCLGVKIFQDAGLIPNPPITFPALLRIGTPCRALDEEASNTVLGEDFVNASTTISRPRCAPVYSSLPTQPGNDCGGLISWAGTTNTTNLQPIINTPAATSNTTAPSPSTTTPTTPSPATLTTCPANTSTLTAAYQKNKAEVTRVYSLFNSTTNATASACVDLFCVGIKIVTQSGALSTPVTVAALAAVPDDCEKFEEAAAAAVLGNPFYENAKRISETACDSVIPAQLPTLPGSTCGGLVQWPTAPNATIATNTTIATNATIATNGTRSINGTATPGAAGKLTCGLGIMQLAVAAAALLISALLTA